MAYMGSIKPLLLDNLHSVGTCLSAALMVYWKKCLVLIWPRAVTCLSIGIYLGSLLCRTGLTMLPFYRQWCLTGFQKLAVLNSWQEFQLLVVRAILPFAAVFATASINKQLNAFHWVIQKWFGRCHTCVASEMEISGNESTAETSSLNTSIWN